MKVKVKFIRPVYPYKSWDVGYIEEKKVKYFKDQVEVIQEKQEVKQVKKKKNKAILKPKSTKWL